MALSASSNQPLDNPFLGTQPAKVTGPATITGLATTSNQPLANPWKGTQNGNTRIGDKP